jgi:hypothetical protein
MQPGDKVIAVNSFDGWQGTVLKVKHKRRGFPIVTIQWDYDGSVDKFFDVQLCIVSKTEESK